MTYRTVAAALALAALPATALAAPPVCLTRPEAQAMISFVLPDVVAGVAERCTALTGPASYFARTPNLSARYVPMSRELSPLARTALMKNFKLPATVAELQDSTLRDLLRGVLKNEMTKLPAKDCGQIDEVMATLDPLPPANVAHAIVLIMDFTSKPNSPFRICPR